MSTTSAASMATSVPVPIAMPTSAMASAGESFTPSPTIATRFPACWSCSTFATLWDGKTSANTFLMPTWKKPTTSAAQNDRSRGTILPEGNVPGQRWLGLFCCCLPSSARPPAPLLWECVRPAQPRASPCPLWPPLHKAHLRRKPRTCSK